MNSQVYSKMWSLPKALSTFMTFVGRLSCVYPLMPTKSWMGTEALPTFLAFIWFLFRFLWLRDFKGRAYTEAFLRPEGFDMFLPCVRSRIFWARSGSLSMLQAMTPFPLCVASWTFHRAFPQSAVLSRLWALKDTSVWYLSRFFFTDNTPQMLMRYVFPQVCLVLLLPLGFFCIRTVLIFIFHSF